MSVKTSEYACAKYIIVMFTQVPGSALKLVQFSEMGQHWKTLAAKNATVHMMVRPIMTHEMMENVPNMNILEWRSTGRNTSFFEHLGRATFDRKELQQAS